MTRHEDTPERRQAMISATNGLADRYSTARLAVAVMEDEATADIWNMVTTLPAPFIVPGHAKSRAEGVAKYIADLFRVATVAAPNATLAKDALEQMNTADFVRYCHDRLLREKFEKA